MINPNTLETPTTQEENMSFDAMHTTTKHVGHLIFFKKKNKHHQLLQILATKKVIKNLTYDSRI
jgi:hypothetical protein